MRSTEPHRDTETLSGTDGDVGTHLARRSGEHARQRVGHDDGDRALFVRPSSIVSDQSTICSARAGMTEDRPEHAGFVVEQVDVTDDEFDPHRLGPGPEHGEGLRVQVVMHEEALRLRLRLTSGHRHRLGGRGGFVEQRRVGDIESGELGDEGLEVEDRLESALADLGLIRRVGRVPGRVLEHVAGDDRRRDRAVVAHPDQARDDRVPLGDRAQPGDRLVFRDRRQEAPAVRWSGSNPAPSGRAVHRRRDTDRVEHVREVGRRRTDVATDEFVGLEQFGDGRGHAGLQEVVGPRCHRYLRV